MAGEVIHRIREKEDEGAGIIARAKEQAKTILRKAREENDKLIVEKDTVLKKDFADLEESGKRETEKLLGDIAREEETSRKKIDEFCRKNIEVVVGFITREIVKE